MVHDALVIPAPPTGLYRIDRRCQVCLPTAARRMYAIPPGPPVLLVAVPSQGFPEHAAPPSGGAAVASLGLLVVALVAAVGCPRLSRRRSRPVWRLSASAFVRLCVIALLVWLSRTLAAVRAAWRDRSQISLNLAVGSAMPASG